MLWKYLNEVNIECIFLEFAELLWPINLLHCCKVVLVILITESVALRCQQSR